MQDPDEQGQRGEHTDDGPDDAVTHDSLPVVVDSASPDCQATPGAVIAGTIAALQQARRR